jgi:antitoxin component of MazEF toxin-antitoxin module
MYIRKSQRVIMRNGHAIREPKALLEQTQLRDANHLEIPVEENRIATKPASPNPKLRDLVARINPNNRHVEQNWGKPLGREAWRKSVTLKFDGCVERLSASLSKIIPAE